jgi:hypothetical protein
MCRGVSVCAVCELSTLIHSNTLYAATYVHTQASSSKWTPSLQPAHTSRSRVRFSVPPWTREWRLWHAQSCTIRSDWLSGLGRRVDADVCAVVGMRMCVR